MSNAQRIPVDARETKTFTPAALSELEAPPSFVLKAPNRRQKEAMEYALLEDGLRHHSDESIRETTIDELCRLWECASDSEDVERVRAYWRAIDDYVDEVRALVIERDADDTSDDEAPPPLPTFSHPDMEEIDRLIDRLRDRSEILRRMGVDNIRWQREVPRYFVGHVVRKWTGLDTTPRYEAGVLDIDSVVAIREELIEKHGEAGKAAFAELASECESRLYVTRSTEKNSSSPAPSSPTPQAMKETGSAEANGSSPASDPSVETPAG